MYFLQHSYSNNALFSFHTTNTFVQTTIIPNKKNLHFITVMSVTKYYTRIIKCMCVIKIDEVEAKPRITTQLHIGPPSFNKLP